MAEETIKRRENHIHGRIRAIFPSDLQLDHTESQVTYASTAVQHSQADDCHIRRTHPSKTRRGEARQ